MSTVGHSPAVQPRDLPESAKRALAKADLRKAEEWKPLVGRALVRTIQLCGWSLKEFAGAVNRDPRQCARWLNGSERCQLDVVLAVPCLQQPFVQALAELVGADVVTTITVKRIA